MKSEVNLANHYRRNVIEVLTKTLQKLRQFTDLTRNDILSFLDSFCEPEESDPLHKGVGTYNVYHVTYVTY
jgi:hypothetical protein